MSPSEHAVRSAEDSETVKTPTACFANAQLVLPDRVMRGAVHISDGCIVGVTEGDELPKGAVDFDGDYLMPGMVEVHTDNLERHIEPRPKVELPHKTAILAHDVEMASVGVTTVFDALRVGSILRNNEPYRKYARQLASEVLTMRDAGALRARHLLHLRAEVCSDTLLEELAEFGPEDRVGLVSLMDHTPGQRQFRDLAKLKVYYTGKHGFSDREYDEVVSYRSALGERVRDLHESTTVQEARRLGATLASHDDTTVEHVARSKELGISLAEFPTTLEAAQACRDTGMDVIMGAPNLIRGGSHSGNVSALELAEHGLLDILSSDYVPSLLMASVIKLADLWDDLPRAVATITANPARATGLHDRGEIAEGQLADVIRVRMIADTPVVRAVWRGGERIG